MAVNDILEKRNEILKKNIEHLMLKQNRHGLSRQDFHFMQQFIREYHENHYNMQHEQK